MPTELRQLDAAVATTVMGWQRLGSYWTWNEGTSLRLVESWTPSADTAEGWAAMKLVVERMRERGWSWGFSGEAGPSEVCAEFWRDNPTAGADKFGLYIEANGKADSLPLAVCKAALAALGASAEGEKDA